MEKIIGLLISPVIFLLLFLYLRFKYPNGDFRLFFRAFIYGILLFIPVILAEFLARYLNIDGGRSLRRIVVYSFVFVAFVHEAGKFLLLHFSIMRSKLFKRTTDGIIYTAAIGLGLSTLYSPFIVFYGDQNCCLGLYGITFGFMTVMLAVILGFFTGMGKVRNNRFIDSMTGLFAATFFHGIYRFTLQGNDMFFFAVFMGGTLLISFILMGRSLMIKSGSE